jgi:hypothetical protein
MENKVDLFSVFPEIEEQVSGGTAPDFAGSDTPAALREGVNLLERAKRASIYAVMKGGMKYMSTMRDEQEFLEYTANLLINLYAADSAYGRALQAARAGAADAETHAQLAQMALLRLVPELRANLDGVLTMTFEGDERRAELAKVRGYLGDPETEIVPLQRALADVVAAKGGYPIE